MPLPPAEKLSLAVRKNIRDEWENNRDELEKQLSELLGEIWTFEVTPNAIWPYHNEGYAKESLGSCIKSYYEDAIYQLKYLIGRYGSDLATEINTLCPAHTITLDADDSTPKRFSYSGCDVSDGKLRMLFNTDCLGTNISYTLGESNLMPALNAASLLVEDAPLSFTARMSIRTDYDPNIEEYRKQVAEISGKPDFKLVPNFEQTFKKLMAESKVKNNSVRDDWQTNLGGFTLRYFGGLVSTLKYSLVAKDDSSQEVFNEAVDKEQAQFRVLDKLKFDSCCECELEDGVLYLQTTAANYGTNAFYAASKLMEML